MGVAPHQDSPSIPKYRLVKGYPPQNIVLLGVGPLRFMSIKGLVRPPGGVCNRHVLDVLFNIPVAEGILEQA